MRAGGMSIASREGNELFASLDKAILAGDGQRRGWMRPTTVTAGCQGF